MVSSLLFWCSSYLKNKANLKLKSQTNLLVLGHSHPECAFNDSLINNLKNLSQSGESYFYTFQKLKEVLDQNKAISTVFIDFSNNQINENMNEKIWGSKYMDNQLQKYSTFMNTSDHLLLLRKNFRGFMNPYLISTQKNITRIYQNDHRYLKKIGGFKYLIRDKTDSLVKATKHKKMEVLNKNTFQISNYNIEYLSKCVELCQKKGIRVILLRTPLHEKYEDYQNEVVYKEIIKSKFNKVEYLDLSKFHLADSEFGDFGHLNHRGSKKFSLWFNELIANGLLNDPINQINMDNQIKIWNNNETIIPK